MKKEKICPQEKNGRERDVGERNIKDILLQSDIMPMPLKNE
ncbi:hypothetical protein [Thermotalea metallivorans]|uniref:Uncharacterized protein n=1 Tax=Thermotalea metallivorans TaxID=520762 RepID=A0A140LBH8_9FIRM|nr:hypothetical protein [Thermotalea metallivorans]KXG77903.1 hypothetical protein AN619_03580 [Thermotalea metallivorans]